MTEENRSIVTQGTEVENIESAAREDSGFEAFLKFDKGKYYIAEDEVPLRTEFIAHIKAWVKCWIKFVDGALKERRVYRVALGERPPEREDLDDLDQSTWPLGLDDKPADPWVFQYLVPFEKIETGEVVIFKTPSIGGRIAVGDLGKAWSRRAKKVANCGQPKVKLAATDMPSKKWGRVPRPLFEIIAWDDREASGDVEVLSPEQGSFGDGGGEMNDEIPF
jgi:hypothetical protein